MIPYASFLYFGISLYFFLPLIVGAFAGFARRIRFWIVGTTIAMLCLQYWMNSNGVFKARFILDVIGYAVVQWGAARAFLKVRAGRVGTVAFLLTLALALLPLVYVKSTALLPISLGGQFGFIGLSYVSFRVIDVLIDIRDGLIAELPALQYCAYLLFFPTVSSGPIDRYKRFSTDWVAERNRAQFLVDLDSAIQHLMRGFLYKFLLAAAIQNYWLFPLRREFDWLSTVSYMYGYSFYLFFDFAGYSAFAIAFSNLLGVHTPENFLRPFLAPNIREFWNRWHITLSWWFRDHIYMRFVMAAVRGKWFKSRFTASHIGFFLTMGLMGAWHGLEPRYLVYGLYHACLLVGQDIFSRWNKAHGLLRGLWGEAIAIFLTFNAVCFGLLIFSGRLF